MSTEAPWMREAAEKWCERDDYVTPQAKRNQIDRLAALIAESYATHSRTTQSGDERAAEAGEFETLAEKATQGEVFADGWEIEDDDGCGIIECDHDADAAFIAWCFNHRACIADALRAKHTSGPGGVSEESADGLVRAIRHVIRDFATESENHLDRHILERQCHELARAIINRLQGSPS